MSIRVVYQHILPDGRRDTQRAAGDTIRFGRDPACEIALDPAEFPMVSGRHARIEAANGRFRLTHESRSNRTLLNDAAIEAPQPVQAGDRIRLGLTGPIIELLLIESSAAPAQDSAVKTDATVQADPRHVALLRGSLRAKRFEIGQGGVLGRDPASAFPLDHPHVSRSHARLAVDGDRVVLADLGTSNGTFLNGQRLYRPALLHAGDRIDIGPFSMRFDGTRLISRTRSNNIELAASNLKRTVDDRTTGQPLTILDDVSLVVRPHEFVCLLGPSGSGKSTLLAMLSGRNPPSDGAVRINGEDLYADFESLKADIAVVPQKDLLHDSLAVGAALKYTAELRLPADTSGEELETAVVDILSVVGLTERRGTQIRHLSGGQVKRASLANELMSRPSLLFLDEVTSGLDEQTDSEVMQLFRQVADGGKTVVCITHSLANVESTCHLVVILTKGGRLAFVGTPEEARRYFDIPRLGDVYARLEQHPPEVWQARFRSTSYYGTYVADRLAACEAASTRPVTALKRVVARRPNWLRQCSVLIRRYGSILRGDPQSIWAMIGQGLLIAVLLGLVFGKLAAIENPLERGQRTINLELLLAVSCFWLGCNTAAKEFVKERTVFERERAINLRVTVYFASKLLPLCAIGIVQATLLWAIVQAWCRIPGVAELQYLTLCLLAVAGTTIGLLISAVARSEEVATAMVPIVVIPQIILAGVISPLSGPARWLAKGLVTVHWAQLSLERLLPERELELLGKQSGQLSAPIAMILLHILVAVALGVAGLMKTNE